MDLRLKICQILSSYRIGRLKCCKEMEDKILDIELLNYSLEKEIVFSRDGLSMFNVANNYPHSDPTTWLSKDRIWIDNDGLHISAVYKPAYHLWGDTTIHCMYESGRVDTRSIFERTGGVWVANAKLPPSFPAIWTMKNDHPVEGYEKQQIIPETDFAEVIKGKIKQTVHYGYFNDDSGYAKHSVGNDIFPVDNQFHQYAVEFLDEGYNFYVDGYLTAKYRSKNPEFVDCYPNYLIINNAMKSDSLQQSYTELVVESIRYYS